MKKHMSVGLLALLLLAASLALASCAGPGSSGEQGSGEQESGESEDGMQGMDHGSASTSASETLMENGEYSDERFIDAMAPHHQGAVDMARVALVNAEHPEIRQLAENIISSQEAEIEELRSIKEEQFGDPEVPTEMSPEEMEMMGTMEDPGELENQEPFDRAFIDAMIPHHESAIEMAGVASEETDNPRIRDLTQRIIEAQEGEIEQMTAWREEWYPEG
ncbi:MAG TPA: DUF305 domain-containing protein [Rubrobacteraceae bacterium]|nr:DUF305 domain-containing protein [Rubrobacteraceae bacterium]